MKATTRKRVLQTLKARREEIKKLKAGIACLDSAHRSVLASYSKLHDEFMELKKELHRLVRGEVYYAHQHQAFECRWRISDFVLKTCRDPDIIWESAFKQMKAELEKVHKDVR